MGKEEQGMLFASDQVVGFVFPSPRTLSSAAPFGESVCEGRATQDALAWDLKHLTTIRVIQLFSICKSLTIQGRAG